jgi:trk system potassium uptake protein TrkA
MNILIVGCGRIGSGLAQMLQLRNHQITVIDSDPAAFELLGKSFKGQTIIGIGFDREVLLRAGIERADAVAAVTASDEANVVIARMARQVFKTPQVVARVYDPRKAEIYRRFGIQTISPVAISLSLFTDLLTCSSLVRETSLGTGDIDIVSLRASSFLSGRAVSVLEISGEVRVIALTRAGKTLLAPAGTEIREGDVLHMAVQASSRDRIENLYASI